jgi:hypothetical protein
VDGSLNERGNSEVFDRIVSAEPVLIDVQPAGEVVPGMTQSTILTSGAPLAWDDYVGGQRNAILGAAQYEGLAGSPKEAEAKIRTGEITVGACHDYSCIGSLAGIYTASMPVFVVANTTSETRPSATSMKVSPANVSTTASTTMRCTAG